MYKEDIDLGFDDKEIKKKTPKQIVNDLLKSRPVGIDWEQVVTVNIDLNIIVMTMEGSASFSIIIERGGENLLMIHSEDFNDRKEFLKVAMAVVNAVI